MKIKATENHRLGASVNVVFEIEDQEPYNRYVPASDWDTDHEAIIADVFTYITSVPETVTSSGPVKLDPIEMTDVEVENKLIEIKNEKGAKENEEVNDGGDLGEPKP